MDPWEGLLTDAVAGRLARARGGADEARRLDIGTLVPGAVGVVEATVAAVRPVRTFRRRDGREGTIGRVTLRDATGEADLLLWDGDNALVQRGDLSPNRRVRLRGVTVKEGYRGGVELALGTADILPLDIPNDGEATLEGALELDPTTPVLDGDGPRFKAEGYITAATGTARVVLWDDAVRDARAVAGPLRLTGMSPHPALDGWFVSTPATRVHPLPPGKP